MARNVEIKAHVTDWQGVHARAASLADTGPTVFDQDDTFFNSQSGRLKLRKFADGSGELIYYEREDTSGPKQSFYLVTPQSDVDTLSASLAKANGVRGRVCKQRTLYLLGRTRIHLDRVEELGDFIELEVVLEGGESVADGITEARRIQALLGIAKADLVEGAYLDLLGHSEQV